MDPIRFLARSLSLSLFFVSLQSTQLPPMRIPRLRLRRSLVCDLGCEVAVIVSGEQSNVVPSLECSSPPPLPPPNVGFAPDMVHWCVYDSNGNEFM